jgi:hypothetical protein
VGAGCETQDEEVWLEGATAAEDGPDGFDEDVGDQWVVASG